MTSDWPTMTRRSWSSMSERVWLNWVRYSLIRSVDTGSILGGSAVGWTGVL